MQFKIDPIYFLILASSPDWI